MSSRNQLSSNVTQWNQPQGRDLTGQVSLPPAGANGLRVPIGLGAASDILSGTWIQPPTGKAPPVAIAVAVKTFRVSETDAAEMVDAVNRRLIRESNAWLGLRHDHIQEYFGHCTGLGLTVALISPLRKNGNILAYLCAKPAADRFVLVKEITSALSYLHSDLVRIVHGDLHSKNVLIDDHGHALLTDFGRSKKIGASGYATALFAGSTAHMAPELFPKVEMEPEHMDKLFSKATDVYALAMVLYEVLTGGGPFGPPKLPDWQLIPRITKGDRPKHNAIIGDHVWRIMKRCWAQDPTNRPAAADAQAWLANTR